VKQQPFEVRHAGIRARLGAWLGARIDALAALDADPRSAGDGAGRLVFASLAPWIAAALLACYAFDLFTGPGERAWVGAFHATAALLFVAGGVAVHRRPTPRVLAWGARIVFAGLLGVMVAAFLFTRAGFSMLWLGAIPAAAIFVLGLREGLAWCGATLVGWLTLLSCPESFAAVGDGTPWPGPTEIRDFAVAFLALTTIAAAFEFLRGRTRRLLLEQRESLLQASRLESIGHLTSGVAHDFNNLLMVIAGNLDLASQDAQRAAVDLDGLEEARAATRRAAELTSKLLSYAGRQPLRPASVVLEALFDDVLGLLQSSVGERVAIDAGVTDGSLRCRVDRGQLENALVNLAINARDAMPAGGRLTISASRHVERGSRAGTGLAPGEYVRILVSDTGGGIPPEIRARVFEPFYSTKAPGAGTGLGLSMVQGFARQSGGDVRILEGEGAGAHIALYLPVDGEGTSADAGEGVR
jgi:signal transduction histidine kinase